MVNTTDVVQLEAAAQEERRTTSAIINGVGRVTPAAIVVPGFRSSRLENPKRLLTGPREQETRD
jgi:hypothetical protein